MRSEPVIAGTPAQDEPRLDCSWSVTDALRIYDGHRLFKTIPVDRYPYLIRDLAVALCNESGRPSVTRAMADNPNGGEHGCTS